MSSGNIALSRRTCEAERLRTYRHPVQGLGFLPDLRRRLILGLLVLLVDGRACLRLFQPGAYYSLSTGKVDFFEDPGQPE